MIKILEKESFYYSKSKKTFITLPFFILITLIFGFSMGTFVLHQAPIIMFIMHIWFYIIIYNIFPIIWKNNNEIIIIIYKTIITLIILYVYMFLNVVTWVALSF